MAASHGKDAYLAIGTATTETPISAYCDSIDPGGPTYDEADTSVMGQAGKSSIPGQYATSFKFEGIWDATIHAILKPLRGVAGKSIIYGPAGVTNGLVGMQSLGWLKSYTYGANLGGAIKFSAEFVCTGNIAEGTFTSAQVV